jgi:amidase
VLFTGEYMHQFYHGHYYAKAQNPGVLRAYDDVLENHDVLLIPTTLRNQPCPGRPMKASIAHSK